MPKIVIVRKPKSKSYLDLDKVMEYLKSKFPDEQLCIEGDLIVFKAQNGLSEQSAEMSSLKIISEK